MDDFPNKLVVVVNDKLEPGKAMNALSHAMLGFGASVIGKDEARINKYVDADGNLHANISEMPIVVLAGNSNKIRELRKEAIQKNLKFADFLDTMSMGTYDEEYALTKTKKDEELEYRAIILFGEKGLVSSLTKKLSLYK